MKKYLFCILFIMCAGSVHAAVVIDPSTGLTSQFSWLDGLGQIDEIDSSSETEWSINVLTDSTMGLATAIDGFIPGDEFEFVLDGSAIAWSNTFTDGSGYFHGELTNLFLSVGLHTFSLNLTALAPGFTSGGAFAEFSALTPVSNVPLPAAVWLFGSGLIGFIGMRRKTKLSTRST